MNKELPDIRWKQRFSNYKKALAQLKKFINQGNLNELEKQGLIQAFEYTYELGWNLLKDYLIYSGVTVSIVGSRDAIREAFNTGLIDNGEAWMDMVESRIKTSHTYNEEIANEIVLAIYEVYFDLFLSLDEKMDTFLK